MPPRTDEGKAIARANLRPAPPAPAGHERTLKHGVYSDRLEPLREQNETALASDYPAMDYRRRALLADRLARIELASAWVREHGVVKRTTSKVQRGDVFPIVDRLERWASRAEDLLSAAEAEKRERGRAPVSLEDVVAELMAGDDEQDAVTGGSD